MFTQFTEEEWDAAIDAGYYPSKTRHNCSTCIHDGCCDGLPHCGGTRWQPAYVECANCGRMIHSEDVEWQDESGENAFCCENCLGEWEAKMMD